MTQSTQEKVSQKVSDAKQRVAGAKEKAATAQAAATQARAKADQGVQQLGKLTHEHRDMIDGKLDQAGEFATKKLGQQHAGKIAKVKAIIAKGLDKLAAQRPAARAASDVADANVSGAARHAEDAAADAAENL